MKPKHVAFAVILFAVVIAGSSSAGATDRSPVSIHINLDATKVIAGHAIHGTAVLTNVSPAIACAPSVKLKPGVNTFPITVQTIYQVCYQKHLKPRCTKTGMPALPKGTYHVEVVTAGLPKGTISTSPTSVTLR
jgi:hypothetical protein